MWVREGYHHTKNELAEGRQAIFGTMFRSPGRENTSHCVGLPQIILSLRGEEFSIGVHKNF